MGCNEVVLCFEIGTIITYVPGKEKMEEEGGRGERRREGKERGRGTEKVRANFTR